MTQHKVYSSIVKAIKLGKLKEPFGTKEFKMACPGFADGTYKVFLNKHRRGNPGKTSDLFEKIDRGKFSAIRPFKYGL